MAHRDKAIAAAATDAVRALLGSDAVAGSMARDAVRPAFRLVRGAWVSGPGGAGHPNPTLAMCAWPHVYVHAFAPAPCASCQA